MIKYAILLLMLFAACSSPVEKTDHWPIDFDELVVLHCKSIKLKNARFSLADSIRFVQDSIRINGSLNEHDLSAFKDKLIQFEKEREILTQESYALSDSIESKMKRVIRELNVEEKRIFNDSLIARTKAMNCN